MPDNNRRLPIPYRVRVRMEFTAQPSRDRRAVGLTVDRKLTTLKVLLSERFGDPGRVTYEDWLLSVAADQCEAIGGPDAA
jgi:hypothetical protein